MSSTKIDPSADVLRQACTRLDCSAVAVVVADSRSRKLWAKDDVEREFAVGQLRIVGQELARRAVADGAPIVTNRVRHAEGAPIACKVIVVPLRNATGSVVAAMVAINRPDAPGFDDSAMRQLEKFALSLARANASVDARLSGLLAAPVFQATTDNWLTTSPAGRNYCIAYGNIDRMHLANDIAGFEAGDGVIRDAAAAIRARLRRESAATSRGSGDRFTPFLPDRTAEQARQLVADIGKDVAVRSVEHIGSSHAVTMSWGIAPASVGGETLNATLAAAELACRTAKDRGRNRIEIYQRQDASMLRRHDDVAAIGGLQDALREGRIELYAQTIVPLLNETLSPS
ncbi:MAG: diguanylate cyclase [Proteobacteria bacterium]|nr:diguanylate cyclase [Pseudomonadota bacterium]